jgi:hypothetical protein
MLKALLIRCVLACCGPPPAPDAPTQTEPEPAPAVEAGPEDAGPERTDALVPSGPQAQAPRPGQAHGVVEPAPPKGRWRVAPRVLLFLPRYALDIAIHPVRLGLMAMDKHKLYERAEDLLFNDARTFGVWPVLFVETGFGLNGGVRVLHRNLFGHRERLLLRAGWGGLDRQVYSASLGSGALLGDGARLSLGGTFRTSPALWFFGIGDHPLGATPEPGVGVGPRIDPLAPHEAVPARYRRELAHASARARLVMAPHTAFELGYTTRWARFSSTVDDSVPLTAIYDTSRMVGWHRRQLDAYLEAAVVYDDLRTKSRRIPTVTPSTGWRLRAHGGFTEGLVESPSHYWVTGLDVQRYVDLFAGDRVLVVRALADHVIGRRDRIPFTDYPALGGPHYLRGHLRDRFRDRFSTLLSLEYAYPIFAHASGFLFVDAGRVWDSLLAVRPRVPHFGFGGGIQIHTPTTYLIRLQLAGSTEGFFVNFNFSPTSRIRERLSP